MEYEDRLACFGYQYLEQYANSYGVTIVVIDDPPQKNLQGELVDDLLAIVTSFAARLYGRRSLRYRVMKACLTLVAQPSESLPKTQELKKDPVHKANE